LRELSIERPVLQYVERTMTIQVSQWKPSKIAKSRIAKRRSMFIHRMDATCLAAVYIAILFILTPVTPQHPGNKPADYRQSSIRCRCPGHTGRTQQLLPSLAMETCSLETLKCSWQIYRAKSRNRWPKAANQRVILRRMPGQNMVTSKQ